MSTQRAHIVFPEDLIREIDELVGVRGRSAFIVETAREAVNRRRLLKFFQGDTVVWKDEDHPELADGAGDWVRKSRAESEERFAKQTRKM